MCTSKYGEIEREIEKKGKRRKKVKKEPREALPDYVEPSPAKLSVPSGIYSGDKLNVCHGLIDCKNRRVARPTEKSLPNCPRFVRYAIVIPCQLFPCFHIGDIITHVCRGPFNLDTSSQHELRACNSVTESVASAFATCARLRLCMNQTHAAERGC